jgi:hypothetical protein
MPTGKSHVRYDHHNYVAFVHLVCPACQKRAIATLIKDTGESYQGTLFGEMQYHELKSWKIVCESCPFRMEVPFAKKIIKEKYNNKFHEAITSIAPYADLGEFYYKLDSMNFWAYNFDHLDAIIKYLESTLDRDNPYEFIISSYLRSDWKKNKEKLLKLIRRETSWFK